MRKNLLLLILIVLLSEQSFSAFVIEKPAASTEVSVNPNNETSLPTGDKVKLAMKDFKSLSRHERKARIGAIKEKLAALKAQKNGSDDSDKTLLIILAILLPPLAVYLHEDEFNAKFWISLLLWFIFILPGIIYALLVVLGEL